MNEKTTIFTDMKSSELYQTINPYLQNPVVKFLVALFLIWLIKKFGMLLLRRAVRKSVKKHSYASEKEEKQREDTIVSLLDTSLKVFVLILGIMLVLSSFGVELGPLLAGASVVGVAVGLGAQSILKDFLAGIFIVTENQYRVGDWVEIAGVKGNVESLSMRQTVLRDLNGNQHHVPNGSVNVATNKTVGYSNVNMSIEVDYSTDVEKAADIIDKVGHELASSQELTGVIIDPLQFMRVEEFGSSGVSLMVLGKVKPGSQWEVAGEFRLAIKKAFDKAGIQIPFQQVVVHKPTPKK